MLKPLFLYFIEAAWLLCIVCGRSTNELLYDYQSHLNDRSCTLDSLFTHEGIRSLLECVTICSLDENCLAVSFISGSGLCRGCRNLGNLKSESGARIYKKEQCIEDTQPNDQHVKAALSLFESDPSLCVKSIIKVTNGFRKGVWFDPEFCPKGTFAVGYNLRQQKEQFPEVDDTSTNSIKLTCKSPDTRENGGTISSQQGEWGSWKTYVECKTPQILKKFRLQIEPEHEPDFFFMSVDNTAVNFVEFKCGNLDTTSNLQQLWVSPGRGNWGDFGSWSPPCEAGLGVCGIRTKVQLSNGPGESDDTSLNDLVLYCC